MNTSIKNSFCITVENDGKITDFINKELNPFKIPFKKGLKIDETLPVFYGLFPFYKDEILIERMSFEGFEGCIYIKKHSDKVNIYFDNNKENIEQIRKTIQNHNQNKLINKLMLKKGNFLPNDILKDLGFLCFKKKDENFIISCEIPQWFKKLFPYYNYSSRVFDLEDLFPFLEVFLPTAQDLYQSNEPNYAVSELWTQFTQEREELVLKAIALNSCKNNFLLIESVSERNPQKHDELQKSRELYLKHKKLVKSEESIRQLLKYREEFISIISHDIKSPLSGAYSLIDYLNSDEEFMGKLSQKHVRLLDVVHKSLKNVLDYSEQLYEWSNLNFSKIKLNKTEVGILSLLMEVAANFSDRIIKKNLSVEYSIPKNQTVFVDEVFFKNVIQNLFTNAVKFSYQHGSLFFSSEENNDFVILKMKDTGMGMTFEVIKTLFDYSTKVSTTGTAGEKGTGIGLNIVKRILDVHEANIYVESEPKKGTTFTLEIPKG
jgi:signal transduction histidine kinase